MIRGLYTTASAMLAASRRQESIANDASNIQTTGYKSDRPTSLAFANLLVMRLGLDRGIGSPPGTDAVVGAVGTGIVVDDTVPDLSQGPIIESQNPLDLAISGKGFFVLQSPGGLVLTRDGHFHLDADGHLVSPDGYLVMSEGGPVELAPGPATVAVDGTIFQDGRQPVRLNIVDYDAAALQRVGRNSFTALPGAEVLGLDGQVVQGALEGANVNATALMTEMRQNAGTFQAAQRVLQILDATLQRVVNEPGRF